MNVALEKVLINLTGTSDLSSLSISELEKIASDHPYFSAGQLILAHKLQQAQDVGLEKQLQRTAIYLPNTAWLRYQMQHPPSASSKKQADIPTVERVKEIMEGIKKPVTDETLELSGIVAIEEIHQPLLAETHTKQPEVIKEVEETDEVPETTEEVVYQIEIEEKQKSAIASMLNDQLAEFKKPVAADAALPILSEPYHTIDYFASQGIKVDLNKGQDKLTNQLRKFTDWLKHMKSAPANAQDLGTDPELEGAIHNIANTSNETKDVVTETMAEVLVKQGKIEKAVQLYIKLSFLNPDKSAYFAAKIEEIKGI